MAYADRVATTTTSVGTGNLTISATPPLGYVTPGAAFAAGTAGLTLCIVDEATGAFEVSSCTLIDATTISRDAVLSSSNGGALVNFAAGTKSVFQDVPASVINDLVANRPANAAVITPGAVVPATDHIALVQGSAVKRITVENFVAAIGTATPELAAAAALSSTDVIAVTQNGADEVRTTLGAIASFVASFLGGNNTAAGVTITTTASLIAGTASGVSAGTASGATITATTSLIAGSATGQANATASGVTITATASVTAGTASGGAGGSTIAGWSGNEVKATIDAAGATVYGSIKAIPNIDQNTLSTYWTITPDVASAKSGWGTSNTVAPDEITTGQNVAAGASINGMSPMDKPGAFENKNYLWVPNGSGTSTWYFWIKPVGEAAQCINPSGTVVSNA